MTVIAWDGETLAVDGLTEQGGMQYTADKLFTIDDDPQMGPSKDLPIAAPALISGAGSVRGIMHVLQWYREGAKGEFPSIAWNNGDPQVVLVVVNKYGAWEFCHETPRHVGFEPFGWGFGGAMAMGVMLAGKPAHDAVEITNAHMEACGRGVETATLKDMFNIPYDPKLMPDPDSMVFV